MTIRGEEKMIRGGSPKKTEQRKGNARLRKLPGAENS